MLHGACTDRHAGAPCRGGQLNRGATTGVQVNEVVRAVPDLGSEKRNVGQAAMTTQDADRRIIGVMPLHAITAMYGEWGLRQRSRSNPPISAILRVSRQL
jgi:hypothetical protein